MSAGRIFILLIVIGALIANPPSAQADEANGTATGETSNFVQHCVDSAAPGVCRLTISAVINGQAPKLTMTWHSADPNSGLPKSRIPDWPAVQVINDGTTIVLTFVSPTVQQGLPLAARQWGGRTMTVRITLGAGGAERSASFIVLDPSGAPFREGKGTWLATK
jgi:hypothetical protein